MRSLTRPVWHEGMYLGPHHFQAQNRYFEDSLDFITSILWRDSYGFIGLQLDHDALRNGTVSITHGRGLFPDGLAFDFPGSDSAPPARQFSAHFSPVADHLTIHIAVPKFVRDGRNTSMNEEVEATRYRAWEQILPDQNSGLDERSIQVGRKNLLLLSEGEINATYTSLPFVRVVRDGAGRYEMDPSFVPPCLSLNAAPVLSDMLCRLIDILDEKSTVFTQEQQQGSGAFQAGMSGRHVAQFWFLHAVNSNLPTFRHMLQSHAHPQELYREMSRLAGALCTFGLDVHPRSLPPYDHAALGNCFAELDQHIRRHLEIVLPSKAIKIPLRAVESFLYYGEVTDERCIGPSRWILDVQSPAGEADLIMNIPKLTKVCSLRFVGELIKRALPGLTLSHLQVPPPQIAARVESQYFSIQRVGPCWEHIVQTRQVGVYVPAEIPTPQLTLVVLLD